MPFRFLGFLVLFLMLFPAVACGGGSEEGDDLMIDFGDGPAPDVGYQEAQSKGGGGAVGLALSVNPEVLIEVRFLYEQQVRLETLRRLHRDLEGLLEYSSPSDVDLDWVIEVHEVTEEADEFFLLLTSLRVPEYLRGNYEHVYISMLESVQVMGLGLDRVLSAALTVGPTGRSLLHMDSMEVDEFETLMRESKFYLRDSERLLDRQIDGIGDAIGQIRLR